MAVKKTTKAVKPKVVVAIEDSPAKKELLAYIERLKASSPTGYEKNKEFLTNKLNQL